MADDSDLIALLKAATKGKRFGENEFIIRLWSFVWKRCLHDRTVIRVIGWNMAVVENRYGERQTIIIVFRERNEP